jgi:hypothetical protein
MMEYPCPLYTQKLFLLTEALSYKRSAISQSSRGDESVLSRIFSGSLHRVEFHAGTVLRPRRSQGLIANG